MAAGSAGGSVMAVATDPRNDLDEALPSPANEEGQDGEDRRSWRPAVAAAAVVVGAAVMVGGVFTGFSPRLYAAVSGLAGVGLAVVASRIERPLRSNAVAALGIFGIGLLMLVPSGAGAVLDVRQLVDEAAAAGDVLRPPVPFSAGWQAVVGWLMGMVGFLACWISVALRRGGIGVLLPLPIAAMAGVSVPEGQQVASGIAVLVLFALALATLSADEAAGDDEVATVPLSFQVRRAVRALPLLAGVTVALYLLAQTDFLFPEQLISPAQEAQKPKTVPLSEVEDRVLFEVESTISGPWRLGGLDVYDGKDWRLPPFAQSELDQVPRSGIVDRQLQPGVTASFTVAGLGGAVLPGLPNPVGIRARGPLLAYDRRNANIRLVNGQVEAGLRYAVVAAAVPGVDALKVDIAQLPETIEPFVDMPVGPPPAVADLIAEAPKTSKWDEFDFLRTWILENVTATGAGAPKSVPPERVADMIAGSREGTPFELVAAQAMLARWIGVPARIGYGFDGGESVGGRLQVRPRHGATFVEVYFPSYKWLPVVGVPKKAKPTSSSDSSEQRVDPNILPSDDIAVRLVFPVITPAPSTFAAQVRNGLAALTLAIILLLLAYFTYPVIRKGARRSRRRAAARAAGPRARVALAYAEWRDTATDFGCFHPTDTPIMFLDRFPEDVEHEELAWLTTRVMWGDLRDECEPFHGTVAEELSRTLRRRMALAQPATLRAVAAVSRLSLRDPYLPHEEDAVAPDAR